MNEIEKLENRIDVQNEQLRELHGQLAMLGIFIAEHQLQGELEEFTNTMKARTNQG